MCATKPVRQLVLPALFTLALSACAGSVGQITDPQGLPAPVNVRVWADLDGDSKRAVSEPPLPGVSVQLVDPSDGRIVDEAVTDASGEAEVVGLQDLLPSYQLQLVVPDGYTATTSATFPLADTDYRTSPISFGLSPVADG